MTPKPSVHFWLENLLPDIWLKNNNHDSDGSDFDQKVIYPGELEPCFKADGDKVMSQDHRTHLTVLAKWGSSLAFGGGTNGTLYVDFT